MSVTPVSLASGQKVLFVGDGWFTEVLQPDGLTATSVPEIVSDAFRWEQETDAVVNSGYLNAGPEGDETLEARLERLPESDKVTLVVIQGSLSDVDLDRATFTRSVASTWRTAQERFPNAAIVVVGPAPTAFPASPELVDTDLKLAKTAETAGLAYVSTLEEEWIPRSDTELMFTSADDNTLTPAGAIQIADKLEEALKALAR